LIDEET
jgi:hypothetical protein